MGTERKQELDQAQKVLAETREELAQTQQSVSQTIKDVTENHSLLQERWKYGIKRVDGIEEVLLLNVDDPERHAFEAIRDAYEDGLNLEFSYRTGSEALNECCIMTCHSP